MKRKFQTPAIIAAVLLTFVLMSTVDLSFGGADTDRAKPKDDGPLRKFYPCGVWSDPVQLISYPGEPQTVLALPIDLSRVVADKIEAELEFKLGTDAAQINIKGRNFIVVNQPATLDVNQTGRIAMAMEDVDCE